MHVLLLDLGLDLETRRTLVRGARDRFAAARAASPELKHFLGSQFRLEREALAALLGSGNAGPLAAGMALLRDRSQRLVPVVAELKACAARGSLSALLTDLAASYLHMHANRLLRSADSMLELALYDFLARLYEAQAHQVGPAVTSA
jgi:thiopeptide-type bacteriocin biosynthesis protein